MIILETERLIIRRFKKEDWKDIYEYLSQESVVKYEPYNAFDEKEAIEEAEYREKDEAFLAVCLKGKQ